MLHHTIIPVVLLTVWWTLLSIWVCYVHRSVIRIDNWLTEHAIEDNKFAQAVHTRLSGQGKEIMALSKIVAELKTQTEVLQNELSKYTHPREYVSPYTSDLTVGSDREV